MEVSVWILVLCLDSRRKETGGCGQKVSEIVLCVAGMFVLYKLEAMENQAPVCHT